MNTKLSITIQGKNKKWSFTFEGDPRHLDEWREDGLDVEEVLNTIPEWAVNWGLCRVWCFFQDIYYFRNPFANS